MKYDILHDLQTRFPTLECCVPALERCVDILTACFRNGGKLMVCGNGGSASDALHIVGELMKSFTLPRCLDTDARNALLWEGGADGAYLCEHLQGALPAMALVGEPALFTAYANDVAADLVFAQQVYGYGRAGDVLLAISTSGNSRNVVLAAKVARARGISVISLTGAGGGALSLLSDALIAVPEKETYRVQELHLPIYHAICLALEQSFWGRIG